MHQASQRQIRNLVVVLGDQLDHDSAAFDGIDPHSDAVWMAEAAEESNRVWSHKARIAVFLSSMRHFRDELRRRGWQVLYHELDEPAALLGRNLIDFLYEWSLLGCAGWDPQWDIKPFLTEDGISSRSPGARVWIEHLGLSEEADEH